MEKMTGKLQMIDLKAKDLDGLFLHYTPMKNVSSIAKEGLLPKIGPNSIHIEETEKIFFAIGTDGFLMIMDVWLRWLAVQANIPKWLYHFGSWYMKNNWTPKIFSNVYLRSFQKSKIIRRRCCRMLKSILDESVVLVLNLEEGKDFSYNDIDEAKKRFSKKSGVGMFYPDRSSLENQNIEYWNMHTFSGRIISPEKISLLKLNGKTNANKILRELIEQDLDGCRDKYPNLFRYYEWSKNIH